MLQEPDIPATSVLLVDGSKDQRAYWADQLKRCSLDHEIIEALGWRFPPRLTGPYESFVVKNTLHNVLAALRDLCKVRTLTYPYVFQYEG